MKRLFLFTRFFLFALFINFECSYADNGMNFVFYNQGSTIEFDAASTLDLDSFIGYITGTLKKEDATRTRVGVPGNNSLFFVNGIYSNNNADIVLTATYDVLETSSIRMSDNAYFNAKTYNPISDTIYVSRSGSLFEGTPVFRNPNSIILANNFADATVSFVNDLNQNVVLNGGLINLAGPLHLGSDVILTGSGTINMNTNNLILGAADLLWTDTQVFINAENLILNAQSNVRGQWKFQNNAHIVGNDCTLDLTNGGSIFIKPNTTLRMSNMTLKGLGTGSVILEGPTSKLELFNVIVDMDKNVTMTLGNVYISGDSTVVTRNKLLTFDQTSSLSVDRSTLFYNTLNYKDVNNIQFTNLSSNFASLNGGSVRKIRSLQVGDYLINTDVILDRTFVVSPLKRLEFQDNATVDGDGFAYMFARQPGQMITSIAASKRAKFTNILLKDFPIDDVVALSRGVNSQLIFGDSTQVELGDSGTLTTTWYVDGNVVINGNGKQLELANTAEIVLRPGASLLLDNMTICGVSVNQIRCMDHLGTVSWGNVTCKMDGDFTYTQGMMTLLGQLDLVGTATFGYASSKPFEITRFGNLFIDKDAAFKYMPPTENRDLIVMDNSAAQIHLNGGNLMSTTTGMRLTVGTLYVDAHSYVQNKDAVGEQESIAFGNGTPADDLTIRLGSSATLDVISGRVIYDNQE